MSRRRAAGGRGTCVLVRITLGRGGVAADTGHAGASTRTRPGAMSEPTTCAWCGLEIQGAEDWIRSDEHRYHAACFRCAQDYRRLAKPSDPPKPRTTSAQG